MEDDEDSILISAVGRYLLIIVPYRLSIKYIADQIVEKHFSCCPNLSHKSRSIGYFKRPIFRTILKYFINNDNKIFIVKSEMM